MRYLLMRICTSETKILLLKTWSLPFFIKANPVNKNDGVYFFKEFIFYQPNIQANISGATMVASLSTMNFGV